MTRTVFITGGAGYIGTHITKHFLRKRLKVVVFDNFSTGFLEPLNILRNKFSALKVIRGDLRNREEIYKALKNTKPDLIIHLAALCSVDESMRFPGLYKANNTGGTKNLLSVMADLKIDKLIFSSTCAVYGNISKSPVKESHPKNPTNVYGETKVEDEKLIQKLAVNGKLSYVIARFFNVCGADQNGLIGDSKRPSSLLVQNAVRGALGIEPFMLTCPKVKTSDGTPIRDYIDVEDLAEAFYKASGYLSKGQKSLTVNLGNGKGYSVKEIIKIVESVLKTKIEIHRTIPRKGEYAKIFADASLAEKALKFKPKKTLLKSILSLAKWYKKHPHGYKY